MKVFRASLIFLAFSIVFFAPDDLKAQTERVSVADDGTEGDSTSIRASVSSDGRYVAFESDATNLVANDTNSARDVFVYDRNTGTIERVSVASDGTEGNKGSWYPYISADGRYVTFSSGASNLVANDNNNAYDVFIYDRDNDTIERIVGYDGTEGMLDCRAPSISSDGRYVAFDSDAVGLMPDDLNGFNCIYVYDRTEDTLETIQSTSGGQPNETSFLPAISADGRLVAFQSYASNLVSGDTNYKYDIFILDRCDDSIERVSIADDGTEGNDNSWEPSIATAPSSSITATLTVGGTINTSN